MIQIEQAEYARSLLRRGISETEVHFLTGVSSAEMYDDDPATNKDKSSKFDINDAHRQAIIDISSGIRQLYEFGYGASDICNRLARLIDVIGDGMRRERI
jgi:hypothetical protein